jgi:beta-lactamase superfamily II metal-dependent hydrolase
LFAEAGERPFRIEVLGTSGAAGVANQGVSLRVVYGDFAMLIGGTMDYDGQYALAQAGAPTAQVLLVPHQGAAHPGGGSQPERTVVEAALARGTAALFDRVQPEVALLEWGNPRPVLGMDGRTAINLYGLTRRFYQDRLGAESVLSTDRDHAIMVYSDGMSYALETQAMRNQAEGGEEDAVSDLAVGL